MGPVSFCVICVCTEKGEGHQQSYPVTTQSVQLLSGDATVPARQDVWLITLQWTCEENMSVTDLYKRISSCFVGGPKQILTQ